MASPGNDQYLERDDGILDESVEFFCVASSDTKSPATHRPESETLPVAASRALLAPGSWATPCESREYAGKVLTLLGLMAMAVFIGGFGAWSVSAPLAEAAIAQGVIGSRASVVSSPIRKGDRFRNCPCATAITCGPVRC